MESDETLNHKRLEGREADRRHLEMLSRGLVDDLHAWRHRRRLTQHCVASLLAVLLPAGLFMALPQRTADSRVLCSHRGDEAMVVARACEGMGGGRNCLVCNTPDGGGYWLEN